MVSTSQCTTETIFDYTWKQVVQAYWNRYPNPSSTHVLTEDTIKREVRDGKLYSRRLLSKTNPVPKWGERFYKNAPVKIIEDSVLDPKEKKLITFTRNVGFKKIMKVDEIVEYTEQQDGRTLAVRRAYISSQVFGFSRAIRAFGIERFKLNCQKAANGFNYVLRNMYPQHMLKSKPVVTMSTMQQTAAQIGDSIKTEQMVTSKPGALKKATRGTLENVKAQINKLWQIFSVKN